MWVRRDALSYGGRPAWLRGLEHAMTDLKVLKQILKMMVDHDLTELDLESEGEKITLKRGGVGAPVQVVAPAPVAAPAAPAPAATPAAPSPATPGSGGGGGGGGDNTVTLDSPMVGSFYAASSPDADDFVKVGDRVNPDTVVCIIEAMKVFNEIKAETSGTIAEVLVDNGASVEFDQPLFRITPG